MATKNTEADTDAPLIDLNEADVKKLIARGKKRGYLTYDELNEALPQDQMSSEQIEDIMSAISDMGINIVESDEDVQEETEQESDDDIDVSANTGSVSNPAIEKKKETVDRTDDPVRMYLREMGAVELLSREGEIAIAKRIEAGRDTMILGLCESPLTFNAIIEWSNALNNGDMQLREIVDLEAMLSKDPAPENLDDEGEGDDGEISEKTAGVSFKDEDEVEEEPSADGDDEDGEGSSGKRESFEEDDEDNTLSLAAMEELLKPDALEKFANITKSFKAFQKLQDARLEALSTAGDFPDAQEKKYHKLREELTAQVESVQFHGTKIEYLVDQLYSYNRRLTALGGQMLRLAERHKVPRKAFLDHYVGRELEENWLDEVGKLDKKWAAFAENEGAAVDRIRTEISEIAQAAGMSLPEFRRVVNMVQKGEREARIAKKEMVEANLRLADNLLLSGQVGHLDGEYTTVIADITGDGLVDRTDLALKIPRLAPWTYGATLTHDLDLPGFALVTSRFSWNHRDANFFSDNNRGFFDATDILDLNITLRPDASDLSVTFYGTNLTNETTYGSDTLLPDIPQFGGDGAGARPSPTYSPLNRGRVLGVEMRYRY